MNTTMTAAETIVSAATIIKNIKPKAKVYLFGSRQRGDFQKYSDIDIAVIAESKIDSKTMLDISDKVQSIRSFYPVQVVDLNNSSKDFYKKVMTYAKEINI